MDFEKKQWPALEAVQALDLLNTSREGLSPEAAAERLSQYGPNALEIVRSRTVVGIFLDQFKDFMIGVLVAAGIVSGLVGEAKDTIAILVIVILNAVIGFTQELRSERAMEALRQMAAPQATVVRAGQAQVIPAADLVPGDIVQLEAGMIVPADLRLFDLTGLTIKNLIIKKDGIVAQQD